MWHCGEEVMKNKCDIVVAVKGCVKSIVSSLDVIGIKGTLHLEANF